MSDKNNIKEIFLAGVDRVLGYNAVIKYLEENPISGNLNLVSIGKAGSSMALAALDHPDVKINSGLVITKRDHLEEGLKKYSNVKCLESDHPTPSLTSLECGNELINFINSKTEKDEFLFLISGGGSSLVELMVDGFSLDELMILTDALLSRGYNINDINAIRKHFSQIKGGKLASFIKNRKTTVLAISDVPFDDPKIIASGPLSYDDLKINLDSYEDDIVDKLKSVKPISCPDANKFSNIDTHVIAKLDDAKLACKVHGKKLNYDTYFHENFIEGDVNDLADYFSEFLDNCEKGLHIWGGESSVQLPENPGRGGRNQQLALLMADKIKNKDIIFLSAGTDGTDGPTNDAGGLVDGDTIIIGTSNNLDHKTYIKNADSGNYLEKSDSLVTTGPTGTNVMDLILAIKK
ncbi:MAG: hydroxypyruvate reductase [Gammaproteobacteria bacterium]|jgi:hydroxypyruvate reductase|nr:hydroxypyruvate reductase [Gammaproteobacteria bacterium]|tara:strand:- start:741 stop:1961 length:1221 start_codon:yes stop_codon:yes gene_type:complete